MEIIVKSLYHVVNILEARIRTLDRFRSGKVRR